MTKLDLSFPRINSTLNRAELSPVQKQQSVILFGDSFTYYEEDTGHNNAVNAASCWAYVRAYLGEAISIVRNAGVGGDTAALMSARLQSDVLDYDSDWVFGQVGVNDFFGYGYTGQAVFDDVSSMISSILNEGRKVVWLLCYPQSSSRTGFTAAKSKEVAAYNKLVTEWAVGRDGVVIVDTYSDFVDFSDTTNGAIKSDLLGSDNIHLSPYGSLLTGLAFQTVASSYFSDVPKYANYGPLESDILGTTAFFAGSSGVSGAGVSGTVPTGWTLTRASGTDVSIVGTRESDNYEIEVTATAASSDKVQFYTDSFHSSLTAGQDLNSKTVLEVEADSTIDVEELRLYTYLYDGTTFTTADWGRSWNGAVASGAFNTGLMLIQTPADEVPTGPTSGKYYLELKVSGSGVIKLKLRDVRVYET